MLERFREIGGISPAASYDSPDQKNCYHSLTFSTSMIGDLNETSNASDAETNRRKLRLFTRGSIDFGILENEITSIADWRPPAPLPNAPDSVLGVVGIQGRMLTVLDVARIAAGSQGSAVTGNPQGEQRIVALQGDEQLALVVDAEGEAIDVSAQLFQETELRDLLTTINLASGSLNVLNPKQLFLSAIQGRERRRRRF